MPKRSRRQIKDTLARALRAHFPEDTVDVSDGYRGNIHVVVVSRRFDGMHERRKYAFLWRIIDATDLSADEKSLISLLSAVSPGEIKRGMITVAP